MFLVFCIHGSIQGTNLPSNGMVFALSMKPVSQESARYCAMPGTSLPVGGLVMAATFLGKREGIMKRSLFDLPAKGAQVIALV